MSSFFCYLLPVFTIIVALTLKTKVVSSGSGGRFATDKFGGRNFNAGKPRRGSLSDDTGGGREAPCLPGVHIFLG
jgi:hypothetical protein